MQKAVRAAALLLLLHAAAGHASNVQPIIYDAAGRALGIYGGQIHYGTSVYLIAVSVTGYRMFLRDVQSSEPAAGDFTVGAHGPIRYFWPNLDCSGEPLIVGTRYLFPDVDPAEFMGYRYLGSVENTQQIRHRVVFFDLDSNARYLDQLVPVNTKDLFFNGGAWDGPRDFSSGFQVPIGESECQRFAFDAWNTAWDKVDDSFAFNQATGESERDWFLFRPFLTQGTLPAQFANGGINYVLEYRGFRYADTRLNDPAVTGFDDLLNVEYPLSIELGDIVVVFESSFGPQQ